MPSYFKGVLGFSLTTAGILCIAPYAGLYISTVFFGEFFKYLQLEYGWRTRSVRQLAQFITFGGASLSLLVGGAVESRSVSVVFIILSQVIVDSD